MIRNLKVLLAAAMALAAFGALSATAHAAEEFHCSVQPCRYTASVDGTGATAHHVFIIKNAGGETGSITCTSFTGEGTTTTKTTVELTLQNIKYGGCKINGVSEVNVRMNSCDYLFTAANGATVAGAEVHIFCTSTPHIEIEIVPTKCIFEVTPQTATGIHYHNIGTPGTTSTEVTVEAAVPVSGVEVKSAGAGCTPKASVGDSLSANYTTGNTIVTAEKDEVTKTMVEGWWA